MKKAPSAPKKAEAKPRLYRAKLDHDGVAWGAEEVAALAEGDVQVPAEFDCKPGAYRWNAAEKRFDPLPLEKVKKIPSAPSLEEAFYDLAQFGPSAPRVVAWCAWFEQSFDALGRKP